MIKEINSNKQKLVKRVCSICGKEYYKRLYRYIEEIENNQGSYCSVKCVGIANGIRGTGSGNPRYASVIKICDVCGKKYECPPRKLKRKDRFGDVYLYCSPECAYKGRSLFYTGERNCSYEYQHNPDNFERLSNAGKQAAKAVLHKQYRITTIHKIINAILEDNNFCYVNEKNLDRYYYDIYMVDFDLYIEIMGDYWHSNPSKYDNCDLLYEAQKKIIERDYIKNKVISENKNNVLYLWESDIRNNKELCEDLIKLFIKNDGVLENYNSFNYYNDLTLKEELTYTHFEKLFSDCN